MVIWAPHHGYLTSRDESSLGLSSQTKSLKLCWLSIRMVYSMDLGGSQVPDFEMPPILIMAVKWYTCCHSRENKITAEPDLWTERPKYVYAWHTLGNNLCFRTLSLVYRLLFSRKSQKRETFSPGDLNFANRRALYIIIFEDWRVIWSKHGNNSTYPNRGPITVFFGQVV